MQQIARSTRVVSRAWRPGAFADRRGLVVTWIGRCMARAAERRALAEMCDWQLSDIGLTRADVAAEARKWFWRN
jgi:uncharacterized protein YjiS (DUF1127 family)